MKLFCEYYQWMIIWALNSFRISGFLSANLANSNGFIAWSTSVHSNSSPDFEINRRRTLAIIAHPDAGKTTLTEKLLLYGGAVQTAGSVRTRANQRAATSDWMELEKQRGISISSTVLNFEFNGKKVNLLDTPGHQDFCEDTYRTLAASDNAVCLIDAAKGLEPQTRKLLEVCLLANLPIFTFANKMDRPAKDPLELMDQIESEFGLNCHPLLWPIGDGPQFQGVLDRETELVHLFKRGDRTSKAKDILVMPLHDSRLGQILGSGTYNKLIEDSQLLRDVLEPLDFELVRQGNQSPMFFGSAMNNFGVELFLNKCLDMCSTPRSMETIQGQVVTPMFQEFTGYVFKLQANQDPRHRDRIAFLRVVSGRYERGLRVQHSRTKRFIALTQAQSLFANEREIVTEAFPGDIIGIHNPGGLFSIGDTLHTGTGNICFKQMPTFSPEVFAHISNPNPAKYKNYRKGLKQLLEEGAVSILRDQEDTGNGIPILAAVGQLQFEVVTFRMKHEYGVETTLTRLPHNSARWALGGWDAVRTAEKAGKLFGTHIAKDKWERPVILFRNSWKIAHLKESEKEHGLQLSPCAATPDI